jgi:hypothetical protein
LVTVNALPTPNIGGTSTICNGSSTTLTASGGTSYSWNTGATTAAITVSPTTNTTYSVTVTGLNGCSAPVSQLITVNALPSASVTGTNSICIGNSTTLTASGGGTYLWNNGATSTSITVSPTTTTTYTVTVTGTNGCTAPASRTVTVNSYPTAEINASSTSICTGSSVTFTATDAGSSSSYSWTFTGASTATATGIGPHNITFTSCGATSVNNVRLRVTRNSCQTTVYMTVTDTIVPVLANVPSNTAVECNAIPAISTSVTATDNCSTAPSVISFETNTQGCDTVAYYNGFSTIGASAPSVTNYFNAQMRIGSSSTYEMSILRSGNTTPIDQIGGGASDNINWSSGVAKNFTLIFNPNASGNDRFVFILEDGSKYTVSIDPLNLGSAYTAIPTPIDFNTLSIGLNALSAAANGGSLSINNLRLNGYGINGFSANSVNNSMILTGWKLNQGFVLSGSMTMSWTGTKPTNSALNIALQVGNTTSTCTGNDCKQQQYLISRTWMASDGCENYAYATQTIQVTDTQAPVFNSPPANVTIECGSTPSVPTLTATDCDASPDIVLTGNVSTQTSSGACSDRNYTITRTWTATDNCGNISTHTQVITVVAAPDVSITAASTQACVGANIAISSALNCQSGTSQTYQWQSRTASTTFSNISGATSASYTTSGLTEDIYLRLVVTQGACSSTSTDVMIDVEPRPHATVSVDDPAICVGGQTTLRTNITGGFGSCTIQWQVSTDSGATWNNVTGQTSTTYPTGVIGTPSANRYRTIINCAGTGCCN